MLGVSQLRFAQKIAFDHLLTRLFRSMSTTYQLLSSLPTCSPKVAGSLLAFIKHEVDFLTSFDLAPKADPNATLDGNALPKTYQHHGKSCKNELSANDLSIVAELANRMNLDPSPLLKFFTLVSNKIVKSDDSSDFRLIQNEGAAFDDGKEQLTQFYAAQFISDIASTFKVLTALLRDYRGIDLENLSQSDSATLKLITEAVDKSVPTLIGNSIKTISAVVERMNCLKDSQDDLSFVIKAQLTNLLVEISNAIETYIIFSSSGFAISSIVEWFKLMESTEYFSTVVEDPEMLLSLQSLATVIGLSFFDLEFNYGSLEDYSFMNSAKDLNTITNYILRTDSNPIILYAWSIILHRKQTVLSMFTEDPKAIEFQKELANGPLAEITEIYTSLAINAEKLDISKALLKCSLSVSYDIAFSNVLGTFVITYIPYVQPNEKIIDTIVTILKSSSNKTVEKFFCSESVEQLMILLKAKMPLSLDMFTSLVSINANLAVEELRSLTSYMNVFDTRTFNLKYAIDDHQPELISLISDIQIMPPYEKEGELCLVLKEGTKGQIIANANLESETLAVFLYEYCGWSLIGRVIKNLSINLQEDDVRFKTIERLVNLLTVVVDGSEGIETVFSSLNEYLDDLDVLDVISRILDQALALKQTKTVSDIFLLFEALTNNGFSHRVWSYLYRSSLFSSKQTSGLVTDILGKAEIPLGDFKPTVALFQLGLSLLSDSLRSDKRVSTKLKSHVLNHFVLHGIRIFEHFITWNFKHSYQRFKLGYLIATLFNKILLVHNGVLQFEYNYSKMNEVLDSAFESLTGIFLIQHVEDLRTMSFVLHTLYSSNVSYSSLSATDLTGGWIKKWQLSSFELCTNLIKVRSSVAPNKPSTLESTFYKNAKGLINIYIFDESLRKPVLVFLKQLIAANWGKGKQPSLLTHLGQTHTQLILQALHNDMSNGFSDDELLIHLYDLFSAIMKNNQEGLSIVLITGKSCVNSIESIKDEDPRFSLFEVLKKSLINYADYPSMVLLHILDSLASLLTTWNGGLVKSNDTAFINKVAEMALDVEIAKGCSQIEQIYNYKLKAKIVDILSLALSAYHGKNKKCEDLVNAKLNDEKLITDLASVFKVAEFDYKVKAEVRRKFDARFNKKYSLDQFVVNAPYKPNDFEVDLPYDFKLLDHLLKPDEAWAGLKREIVKVNMSELLTNSQISLANSYSGMITTYCNLNPLVVNSKYLEFARELLQFTVEEQALAKSTGVFKKLIVQRINLAFLVCFTVSKDVNNVRKMGRTTILSLITSTSQLLDSESLNLIEELTTLDITYSNSLLKILLLSLRMIKCEDEEILVENSTTFVDIWTNVICKGVNIIFSSIRNRAISIPSHEYGNDKLVLKQIDDAKLIFQLMEKFLSLNFSDNVQADIARVVVESNMFSSIVNLYGISHQIRVNDDNVFGDLALLFILEMSKNRVIAEKFVSRGVFQILNESTVSAMIQRGRITPYANDVRVVRLHQLWVERILPIMLTLVGHFQEAILFDICKFALTFKDQIGFTVHSWLETDTHISPIVIEETEQIILLAKVLNTFDCYNFISIETNQPVEEVKLVPGLDTIEERRDFVNVINYLLSHPKYLGSKIRTLNREVSVEEVTNAIIELKDLILS